MTRKEKITGIKKHVSQMTELESDFLMRKFYQIDKTSWSFTPYCQERFNERNIKPEHFLTLWSTPDLIEYHQHKDTHRILLRSRRAQDEKQVCAVFDLTNKVIVTVWTNWINNHHDNLVIEAYNKRVDILEEMTGS
ncbi:hypothetical protein BpsS36_00059 [Bacillus phage vB_BpsS-36]|uniref:Uncharacterized protein n=1 Tax=Bacillus phage vB_BpsS-36 TaxID=2419622 RepID=A0A3G3BWU1_9CAUD|nr:hypothetical protein BpsS36_00059 [Bacillus phage vB_BpsS-36]